MQKLLWIIGGFVWAAICFRTALSVHFPTDEVRNRIQYEAQQSGYDVQFDDLGPNGLVGASIENAKILKVNKRDQSATPFLAIDNLSVSVNPIMLMMSKLSASIDAELFGGTADLGYQRSIQGEGIFDFQSDIQDINLAQIPIAGSSWSLDMLGKLNWTNDVHINPDKIRESYGSGQLSIDGFAIDGGKVAGVELMALNFTEALLAYSIDKGKVTIDTGKFEGEQISIEVNGTIMLKKKLGNSRLALELIMTFGQELKMMARFIPGLEDIGNDQYKLTISGSINNPSTGSATSAGQRSSERSSSGSRASRSSSRAGSSKTEKKMERSGGASAEDLEERRADRARRLEERRAARQKRLEDRNLSKPSDIRTAGDANGPRGIPSLGGRMNVDEDNEDVNNFDDFDNNADIEDEEDFEDDGEEMIIEEEEIIEEPADDYEE